MAVLSTNTITAFKVLVHVCPALAFFGGLLVTGRGSAPVPLVLLFGLMGVALFEALYFYASRGGRVTPKRVSELKHTVLYFFILAFLFWFKALVEGLFRAGPGGEFVWRTFVADGLAWSGMSILPAFVFGTRYRFVRYSAYRKKSIQSNRATSE